MVNSTLCNIIAYLSAVLSFLWTGFSIFVLVVGAKHFNQPVVDSEGNSVSISGVAIAVLVIAVVLGILQFVVSVLLIIGIKKRNHKYILPWLCVAAVSIFFSLLNLAGSSASNLGVSIVRIVIACAMWYPIFSFYRECRTPPQRPNVGYNACPQPGSTVYNQQAVPVYPNAGQMPGKV